MHGMLQARLSIRSMRSIHLGGLNDLYDVVSYVGRCWSILKYLCCMEEEGAWRCWVITERCSNIVFLLFILSVSESYIAVCVL